MSLFAEIVKWIIVAGTLAALVMFIIILRTYVRALEAKQ
jgi:hypothetical protein